MNQEYFQTSKKEWVVQLLLWSWLIASLIFGDPWTRIFPDRGVLFVIITAIIPTYVNAYVLIPRYFTRSKWPRYLILALALLLAINIMRGLLITLNMIVSGQDIDFGPVWYEWSFRAFRSFDGFIFSGGTWPFYISFAYRFIKDWFVNEQIKSRLISEKLTMELALLKSQVNPHFLFNTLNNIYAIALEEKANSTASSISKLGTLMRYSLHDTQADFIPLSKEVNYLEQYIELQRMRLSDDQRVSVDIKLDEGVGQVMIAPMMLMPFVENAFKYGVSTTSESRVDITMKLSGGMLVMEVQNTVHQRRQPRPGGLGLANVERRLTQVYPDRHKLSYGLEEGRYKVRLELHLYA